MIDRIVSRMNMRRELLRAVPTNVLDVLIALLASSVIVGAVMVMVWMAR